MRETDAFPGAGWLVFEIVGQDGALSAEPASDFGSTRAVPSPLTVVDAVAGGQRPKVLSPQGKIVRPDLAERAGYAPRSGRFAWAQCCCVNLARVYDHA